MVIYAYNHHVRLLLPNLWSSTKVYSGQGADIVMQSSSPFGPIHLMSGNRVNQELATDSLAPNAPS
jgi:hypothetical protein